MQPREPETPAPAPQRPLDTSAERARRPRGQRTVRRLMDAATTAFAERGFGGTRVDDIVRRAETSHGTFYLYFTNKEDLLGDLLRESEAAVDRLADEVPAATDDARAHRSDLRRWLEHFDRLYRDHGPVIRAGVEAHAVAPSLARRAADATRRLAAALAAQIPARVADEMEPDGASRAVVAMLERTFHLREIEPTHDQAASLDTLAVLVHRCLFAAA